MAHSSSGADSIVLGSTGASQRATHTPSSTGSKGMHHGEVPTSTTELLYRTAEKFGIPLTLLVLVLWWARNDIVQPLLNAHFEVVGKLTDAHKNHTEELKNIGDKLDTLIDVSKQR